MFSLKSQYHIIRGPSNSDIHVPKGFVMIFREYDATRVLVEEKEYDEKVITEGRFAAQELFKQYTDPKFLV
jgi:hypothetical protein